MKNGKDIEQLCKLMHQLCLRRYPDITYASDESWMFGNVCIYCRETVPIMTTTQHGLRHLRENKLLVFL